MSITSRQLRRAYLDFFAERGHRILPSYSLQPPDPTTLFTSAGMQQFVPWWRGEVPPGAPRVATCQKCFRTTDIEEVGDAWHCSFFEMLGNFSFGDYFKEEAIEWAWEFSTRELDFAPERIWITVHTEDEEAPAFWQKIGIPAGRILRFEDNWWGPVGKAGPCGPCSELYLDFDETLGCGRPDCRPSCENPKPNGQGKCERFVEYWNLVFPSFNKLESGEFAPLRLRGIDTGMGLERVVGILEKTQSLYETSLLQLIVSEALTILKSVSPKLESGQAHMQRALRIIAEHARALTFLLADGFTPSNEGAGYVVRRVLRRAYLQGHQLGMREPFLHRLSPVVEQLMGETYHEVRDNQKRIQTWMKTEEEQFQTTLERALPYLEEVIEKAKPGGVLPGEEGFRLHDTYGLPKELTAEYAREQGLRFDEEGFAAAMAEQQARGRAFKELVFGTTLPAAGYADLVGKTRFVGYESLETDAAVIGIVSETRGRVDSLGVMEFGEIFLDVTPFYAESGGQVGDEGELSIPGTVVVQIKDTRNPVEGAVSHLGLGYVGELHVGQRVTAQVDAPRRQAIARAHSATHLLHFALRKVLGPEALQKGSRVEPDRFTFDFAHPEALTAEELRQVEAEVNARVLEDAPSTVQVMSLPEARAAGALALFGEKYGEQVRLVRFGDYSKELCGGTHLPSAGRVGPFLILRESSIGAGLRRIEALTGAEAYSKAREAIETTERAAGLLKARPEDLPEKVEGLLGELRQAQREIASLRQKQAVGLGEELLTQAQEIGGVKVIAAEAPPTTPEALRTLADRLLEKLGSGIIVLGTVTDGRVSLVSEVSKDLVGQGFHAGNLVREVAKVAGGGGGGRPDFAQAGGKDPAKLGEALGRVAELVTQQRQAGSK